MREMTMAEGKPNFRVVERLKIKIGEWYNIITLHPLFRVVFSTRVGGPSFQVPVSMLPPAHWFTCKRVNGDLLTPEKIFMNDRDFFLSVGDAKNLGKGHSSLRDGHCTITLDQEEIFRTATIEKAIE